MTSLKQATLAALALTGLLSLGACATAPGPLSGHFPPIVPQQAQSGQYLGETVRWGGVIVTTKPGKHETCFRVMGLRLGRDGRPLATNQPNFDGRFLACAKGFFDPQLYARGRRVTFVGTITRVQQEKVGNYNYPYPRLAASVVYLWPHRRVRRTHAYFMNGWWAPYGTWGWWPWAGFSTWDDAPPPYYRAYDPHSGHRDPPAPRLRHRHVHATPPHHASASPSRVRSRRPHLSSWKHPVPPSHPLSAPADPPQRVQHKPAPPQRIRLAHHPRRPPR